VISLADVCVSQYLAVACACATFVSSFGLGWDNISNKKPDEVEQTTVEPVTSIDTLSRVRTYELT
jgi:hypothetical protein